VTWYLQRSPTPETPACVYHSTFRGQEVKLAVFKATVDTLTTGVFTPPRGHGSLVTEPGVSCFQKDARARPDRALTLLTTCLTTRRPAFRPPRSWPPHSAPPWTCQHKLRPPVSSGVLPGRAGAPRLRSARRPHAVGARPHACRTELACSGTRFSGHITSYPEQNRRFPVD